jgi:hypothetical protein
MYIFKTDLHELSDWIRAEVEFTGEVSSGHHGIAAKRVQEWLTFHGFGVAIDSDFGPVTKRALERFQEQTGLAATGVVNEETANKLVEPMRRVLMQRPSSSPTLGEVVLSYAQAHLAEHPIELGGQNCGPWVRLYMRGNEGESWAWCAGFAMFVARQAAESLNTTLVIKGSFSCDSLAAQSQEVGVFLAERDVVPGDVPPGSLFLTRRTDSDWTHTGLVTAAFEDAFDTVEGNTNDDGHREGFEVCARSRGYKDKDFILLATI